jgi:hypothetical protein
VLNKVKAMLVWSSRPFPILGFLVTGIVMEKQSVKEYLDKTEKFEDNREYNQPERYGISPQYGRKINVEENVWKTLSIFRSCRAKTR